MRPHYRPQPAKPAHRINQYIKASEVRLLAADNTQIGVVSIEEARENAKQLQVDLVEIAGNAVPPVVKLIDYKKFLYQLNKKQQNQKSKGGMLKEVRLTPYIADGDLQVRINRTKEFLSERFKVRVYVKFTGRQMYQTRLGFELLDKFFRKLEDKAKIDQNAKLIGREVTMTITTI